MCLAAIGSPAGADTYPRQPGIDATHYVFALTLRDDTDRISGEAIVELRFVHRGVTEVALDLTSVSEANDGKGMTVSAVTSDGAPVPYVHKADRLHITLTTPPRPGELRRFTVRYGGVPASGLRIGTNLHGERTFFSLNWPDKVRQWLPIIDHPYDKATHEFLITAPARYQVVANGLLQEETDLGDGRRLTHWKQSVPIASWLKAIGVAQFATRHFGSVKGVPLQTWVFHDDRDAGIATFEVPVRRAIEFYAERIGPYPYEKLANVQAAGLGGGTEHASVIFYGEKSVTMRPATGLVAHEIAHEWFGNSVTESDWDHVWLSEGFATYFTLLFTEHYEGRDAFVTGLQRSREQVFELEDKLPGVPIIHDNLSDMQQVLNQLVYQKGAWVLHMLRRQIGTETFWTGIREYYRRYRDANASTEDLRQVMEEASGQDLSWFFQQWLHRAVSPQIEGTWHYDSASKRIVIHLTQLQAGDAYRLSLDFAVSDGDGQEVRVVQVEMVAKQQRFEVAVESEPVSVVLDPNTWTLLQARFEKR